MMLAVPRVYVRVKDGDLQPDGTLLAGREVNINLTGDLTNSGTMTNWHDQLGTDHGL